MNKLKQFLLDFVKSKKFHTFLWQTLNGFLVLAISVLADLDWQYVPVLLAVLNYITKYINTTYLS